MVYKRRKGRKRMNAFDWITTFLLIIGGINWLLIGAPALFGANSFDLVAFVFGNFPFVQNIVYSLVGVSALYWLFRVFSLKR